MSNIAKSVKLIKNLQINNFKHFYCFYIYLNPNYLLPYYLMYLLIKIAIQIMIE